MFVDSAVIPLDVVGNAKAIDNALKEFMKGKAGELLKREGISVGNCNQ